MKVTMRILSLIVFLTVTPNTVAQQVIVIQPRQQSNSLWNPANLNREWLDFNGRSGRQREVEAVPQWVVTPIPRRSFPNLRPLGKTVVILNPFAK